MFQTLTEKDVVQIIIIKINTTVFLSPKNCFYSFVFEKRNREKQQDIWVHFTSWIRRKKVFHDFSLLENESNKMDEQEALVFSQSQGREWDHQEKKKQFQQQLIFKAAREKSKILVIDMNAEKVR